MSFEEIMILIAKSFWFILPAYIANMSPYAVRKINFLSQPISEKYLGSNKTWRGFLFAVFIATIVACLQSLVPIPKEFLIYDYSNPIMFGALLGLGAMTGDLIKSFFKRRIGIAPGKSWFPFDQLDFILGALVFVSILRFPGIETVIVLLLLTPALHMITNYIGYLLKVKKSKL